MGFKAGLGVNLKRVRINYGFDLFRNLGATHFMQVNIPIGTSKKEEAKIALSLRENSLMGSADDYILNDEYEEALPIYKEAIQLNPENSRASYNLACVYSVLNDLENGRIWLDYTLRLDHSPEMLLRIENDRDLGNLRNTNEYREIMYKYGAGPAPEKPPVTPVEETETPEDEVPIDTEVPAENEMPEEPPVEPESEAPEEMQPEAEDNPSEEAPEEKPKEEAPESESEESNLPGLIEDNPDLEFSPPSE